MAQVEITIPDSLNEIVLGQYQDYVKISSDDEIFMRQKMLQYFCGLRSEVLSFKASDLFKVSDHLINLLSQRNQKFVNRFTIQGIEFGFIPDLENISTAEYLDLDNNIGDWSNMNKAMAVLYRPIKRKEGERYEIEEYNGTANYSDLMKFAPMSVVFGALVFFYDLGKELLEATKEYLAKESHKMISQLKADSIKNGDGITQSIQSLEDRLNSLIKF